jgi:hypothetical protein
LARSQLSGDEMVRLLNILADRLNGATQYELTVLNDLDPALIYPAVQLDLLDVEPDAKPGAGNYRFHLAAAGRSLLQSG